VATPETLMSLTLPEVERIAHLARIQLDPAEAQHMHAQINDIFGLIEQLQSVDTTGVAPMTNPQEMALRLRPDDPTEPDQRAECQAVAPAHERGLYLVPKVIE
jgi:aspartyl-tRNA(Asn)/glutamyl-tRNA(Gln) amidotransferase subunit C